jgi:hypothetical protein
MDAVHVNSHKPGVTRSFIKHQLFFDMIANLMQECIPSASIIMRDRRGGNSDHEKQKEVNKDDHGARESSRLRLTGQRENGSQGHNSDRDRGPG